MLEHYLTHARVRDLTAMVIPVWFPPDTPAEETRALLGATLADVEGCVAPERLALVVDGAPHVVGVVEALQQEVAARTGVPFLLRLLPSNLGKGAAIVAGIEMLPEAPFVVVRDADGDHVVDDVPHLVRLAHQIATEWPGRPVVVIGRRESVHAPLGWVRGEYELLLNEVVLDALRYALAREGSAPVLSYCAAELPPDFQSGFKVYSAEAARLAAEGLQSAAAQEPDLDMLRWGMELVPLVAVSLAGGVFGEADRKAYYDQPVTAYGRIDRPRAYGAKAAWVLRRCGVSPEAARRMLDNALVRRPMHADPAGREELLAFRAHVLAAVGAPPEHPVYFRRFL